MPGRRAGLYWYWGFMEAAKISPPLAEELKESTEDNWLDVIVELARQDVTEAANASRQAKIEAQKQAFEQEAEPVVNLIQSLGGEVTGKVWLNGSLRAKLDKKMISALSSQRNVSRLDLPHLLKADVK
jgi:hypothetical protein